MTWNVPNVTFAFRQGDEVPDEGGCPIGGEFVFKTTQDLFAKKRVVVFSLPGAFTPTCSTYQLPGFEEQYEQFKAKGIDEIYCMSVNDAFVMNAWAKSQNLENVKVIPDGSGLFTKKMGMLVKKDNLGFGVRSWRYAAVLKNGVVEKLFVEPGLEHNCSTDPYGETSPQNVLEWLKKNS
jgi:peroxiredoxin